jgi:hypothetical protein
LGAPAAAWSMRKKLDRAICPVHAAGLVILLFLWQWCRHHHSLGLETNSNLVIVFHVPHNFFPHMLSQFSYIDSTHAFSRSLDPIPTCCSSPAMAMTMLGDGCCYCRRTLVSNPSASSWTHLFLFFWRCGSFLMWQKP